MEYSFFFFTFLDNTVPLGLLYSKNMQRRMAQELNCKTSNATNKMYDEALTKFHEIERKTAYRQGNSAWKSMFKRRVRKISEGGEDTESEMSEMSEMSGEEGGGGGGGGGVGSGDECVEGEVWWPWTAYSNVLEKMKEMRATESRGGGGGGGGGVGEDHGGKKKMKKDE